MSVDYDPRWFDQGTKMFYHFNEEGVLVSEQGGPVTKDFIDNDGFTDWVNQSCARMMIENGLIELNMKECGVPIYHSPGALRSPKKLLVVIQGTGRVRAGAWSIKICMNNGLKQGSVISAIHDAKARNMEIIVLNPNDPGSKRLSSMYKEKYGMILHTLAVFEHYILPAKPENVFILCHSMGGECTLRAISHFPEWSMNTVRAIAMTDACEIEITNAKYNIGEWLFDHAINWVCSSEKANKHIGLGESSWHYSAGTNSHPLSTAKAWAFIWVFFDKKGAQNDSFETLDLLKYKKE